MTRLAVRSARLQDAEDLARLFGELGHRQTTDALRGPLEAALGGARAGVLVAEARGAVIGAATYFFVPVVHDTRPWCRITTLIVDEAHRGQGIGRALLAAVEAAARDAGCARIEATSAVHRTAAHRFYERLGYGQTSAHFLKRL
jgi:GNAT superfamily N-acetyltransferase